MKLIDVLKPEHVVAPLRAETFRDALAELIDRLVASGAVRERAPLEHLTGEDRIRDVVHVGDRVLLPHTRTDAVDELVVALGVAPRPLRRAQGAAPESEQVVVLVIAPPSLANRYLQVVAALARALRSDDVVDRLVRAGRPEEVLQLPEIRELTVPPRLTVRDLMTQRVYRVYPDTPVRELLDMMRRHNLAAVPVVGEKREVLGMVNQRDLLRHLMPSINRFGSDERPEAAQPGLRDVPVRDIMSRSVLCISEDQGLGDVVSIMINKDMERLPVVSEGKLTGFLTRGDILRKLFGE